jgi:hypothetical protein
MTSKLPSYPALEGEATLPAEIRAIAMLLSRVNLSMHLSMSLPLSCTEIMIIVGITSLILLVVNHCRDPCYPVSMPGYVERALQCISRCVTTPLENNNIHVREYWYTV